MRGIIYWVCSAIIYVPLLVWLQPPWYGSAVIGLVSAMLTDIWLASWWKR